MINSQKRPPMKVKLLKPIFMGFDNRKEVGEVVELPYDTARELIYWGKAEEAKNAASAKPAPKKEAIDPVEEAEKAKPAEKSKK